MFGDRDRVIMAEMVARCWQDANFADEFAKDPVTKLREAGMDIPPSMKVAVFRSTDTIIYMGLSHSMSPEDYLNFAKTQFDPLLPLSDGIEIRIVQSTPTYLPIIIPPTPKTFQSGELSDAELASVAGGGGYLVEAVNVVSTANAVAEANGAAVSNAVGATEAAAAAVAVALAVIAVVLI